MSLKGQVGIAGADLMLGDLATLLKEQAPENMVLARLSDDAFCLLCQPCEEKIMAEQCEAIRKKVEDHLFDINGRTVQLTLSIGVAAITENAPKAPDLMGRAHTASSELKKSRAMSRATAFWCTTRQITRPWMKATRSMPSRKPWMTIASSCFSNPLSIYAARVKNTTRPSSGC